MARFYLSTPLSDRSKESTPSKSSSRSRLAQNANNILSKSYENPLNISNFKKNNENALPYGGDYGVQKQNSFQLRSSSRNLRNAIPMVIDYVKPQNLSISKFFDLKLY